MAINRVLYATQTARLWLRKQNDSDWAALPWVLAVQTASADETIPQDDVLVLGKLGGAARVQKDVATSKASLKAFLVDDIDRVSNEADGTNAHHGSVHNMGGTAPVNGDSALLSGLEDTALRGLNVAVHVDSKPLAGLSTDQNDGFVFYGICSNISIDASKGAFPTLDLAFEGVGRLYNLDMGTTGTLGDQNGGTQSISKVEPLTSRHVAVSGASTDTIASVKFSYDMPTETLSALGGQIVGSSAVVGADNRMFAKPPFKASMNADGQGLNGVSTTWATSCYVDFKHNAPANTNGFRAAIPSQGLNISSRSFSQNVGDVGATFSVAAEGTDATFTAI